MTAVATGAAVWAGADPQNAPVLVGLMSTAGSIFGNLASNSMLNFVQFGSKKVKENYFDGWHQIDGNHRVYQALRKSQIISMRAIVTRYEDQWRKDTEGDVRNLPPPTGTVRAYLEKADREANDLSFMTGNTVDEQERVVRGSMLRSLSDNFNATLSTRQADPSTQDEVLYIASECKTMAEAAVLEELRHSCFGGEDASRGFLDSFFGLSPFEDSWHDLFVRDFSAKIRNEQDIANIWQAEQQATIKSIVEIHTKLLLSIKTTGESTNIIVRDVSDRLSAIETRIADAFSKSNLAFDDPVHWTDMTGGIAAGYFQNFIRQFLASNGPIADGSFLRLVIIKPHSLYDFSDPMNEFYRGRSSRILRKQTFVHPSLPREKAVIDVFDEQYIVDYPTPLNSLRHTVSFDIRWRNIPFNRKELQIEYQHGLIDAFFYNIEQLIIKDENYKLKYLDIVTVEEFDRKYINPD
jgi:hypothetical protein